MRLQVADTSRPTGRLLATLLEQKGVDLRRENAVICYGVGYKGTLPALNANVGRYNKFDQFRVMRDGGVRVPDFYTAQEALRNAATMTYPLFGRKFQHKEGKDIMVALQPEHVQWRVAAGSQFFTRYIPCAAEFRVWVYRRRHMCTYAKVMRHPDQYKFMGNSYRNGFAFELMRAEAVPRDAVEQAALAVQSLGLDFGAVDVLQGKDNRPHVLEVNTAPGVDGARVSITALADKIANWAAKGFPKRNGANE
jgi:hypothetical protein